MRTNWSVWQMYIWLTSPPSLKKVHICFSKLGCRWLSSTWNPSLSILPSQSFRFYKGGLRIEFRYILRVGLGSSNANFYAVSHKLEFCVVVVVRRHDRLNMTICFDRCQILCKAYLYVAKGDWFWKSVPFHDTKTGYIVASNREKRKISPKMYNDTRLTSHNERLSKCWTVRRSQAGEAIAGPARLSSGYVTSGFGLELCSLVRQAEM